MNCERFHDQLFDLLSGTLGTTQAKAMLEHSKRCPECDAVLSLEESLQTERAEGVAAKVPESWIDTMWPAVMAEIGTGKARASLLRAVPVWGWARFAMASLLTVFLVGTGYFLGQRVPTGDEPVLRPPGLRVNETTNALIASKPEVADLLAALDRLPDDTTLVSPGEAQALLRQSFRLRRWAAMSRVPLDFSDGVQVSELRAVLDEMPQDVSMELPGALNAAELTWWLRRRA